MQRSFDSVSRVSNSGIISTNKVIRNTYILLSMTVLFSAFMAFLSTISNIVLPFWFTIIGYFGLLYLTHATANSSWGVVSVFAFTGFLGFTLGPMLNYYIHGFSNGPQIIGAALASTGAIFFALSGYAMTTRKDFSFLGGFLFVGLVVALLASVAGMFFNVPALHLAVSSAIVLLMGGFILFETSQIIHGGQRNYILATISIYVSLYNMFISLMHIFGALAGNRD